MEQPTDWLRGRATSTVEGADKLVASVMQRLAEGFANERSGLEKQWDRAATTCPVRICGLPTAP